MNTRARSQGVEAVVFAALAGDGVQDLRVQSLYTHTDNTEYVFTQVYRSEPTTGFPNGGEPLFTVFHVAGAVDLWETLPGDALGDQAVTELDLFQVVFNYGVESEYLARFDGDLNADEVVDVFDIMIVLQDLGWIGPLVYIGEEVPVVDPGNLAVLNLATMMWSSVVPDGGGHGGGHGGGSVTPIDDGDPIDIGDPFPAPPGCDIDPCRVGCEDAGEDCCFHHPCAFSCGGLGCGDPYGCKDDPCSFLCNLELEECEGDPCACSTDPECCANNPCSVFCGGEGCGGTPSCCDVYPCSPSCGGDGCETEPDPPNSCKKALPHQFVCSRTIKTFGAGCLGCGPTGAGCKRWCRTYCGDECNANCDGTWIWSVTGPATILEVNGLSAKVRFNGPGKVVLTVKNGCCTVRMPITSYLVRLESVRFNGGHEVRKDSDGNPYAPAGTPHWKYGELNTSQVCLVSQQYDNVDCCNDPEWYYNKQECYNLAVENGSTRHPVAYTRGSLVAVDVRYRIQPIWLDVKEAKMSSASQPGVKTGIELIKSGSLWEANGVILGPGAGKALPQSIAYHEKFIIAWPALVKINIDDDKTINLHSGDCGWANSMNTMYVTLANPSSVDARFHTVIHRACKHAHGKQSEADAVSGIWSYFEGMKVQKFEDEPTTGFKYWGPSVGVCAAANGNDTTQCLITNFDAPCGSWTRFLRDVLKVHGIEAKAREIWPDPPPTAGGKQVHDATGIRVKYWVFPNGPFVDEGKTYFPQNPDIHDPSVLQGLAGQGGGRKSHEVVRQSLGHCPWPRNLRPIVWKGMDWRSEFDA